MSNLGNQLADELASIDALQTGDDWATEYEAFNSAVQTALNDAAPDPESPTIRHADTLADLQDECDAARADGGGVVVAPTGTDVVSGTIQVPPGVTLHLPSGCIIEPAGAFDIIQIHAEPHATGRVTGPGLLRTDPAETTVSTITEFDGQAHILVDGEGDWRQYSPHDRPLTTLVDGVRIRGAVDSTGGYGIHLRCGGFEFIWLQKFRFDIMGCENAIRCETHGPNLASINGNVFEGSIYKPIQAINSTQETPAEQNINFGTAELVTDADEKTTTLFDIEGDDWQITDRALDVARSDLIAHFHPDAESNLIRLDTRAWQPALLADVTDEGTNNRVNAGPYGSAYDPRRVGNVIYAGWFDSVQQAVDTAENGQTVLVPQQSTDYGSLTISNNIILRGSGQYVYAPAFSDITVNETDVGLVNVRGSPNGAPITLNGVRCSVRRPWGFNIEVNATDCFVGEAVSCTVSGTETPATWP